MYKYSFDKMSLAIAVSKDELEGLLSGSQIAVLKNTRTPYKGGIKCYLYETKSGGGRGAFVAIANLEKAKFYKDNGVMCKDCNLTAEEANKKVSANYNYVFGSGVVFYLNDVVEVDDPDVLSREIYLQFLIDPPKKVTQMKK